MPYFLGYTGETAGFPEIQCFKTCDLVDKKLWCRGALAWWEPSRCLSP